MNLAAHYIQIEKSNGFLPFFGKLGCFYHFFGLRGFTQNTGLKKPGTFGTLGTALENIGRKVFQKVFRSGTPMEQFGTKIAKCSNQKTLGTGFGTGFGFLLF